MTTHTNITGRAAGSFCQRVSLLLFAFALCAMVPPTATLAQNGGTSGTGVGAGSTSSQSGSNEMGMGTGPSSAGTSENSSTNGMSFQNGSTGQNSGTGSATRSLPQTTHPGQVAFDIGKTVAAGLASSSDFQNAARNVEIDRREADRQAAVGRPALSAEGTATRYDQATTIALGGQTVQVLPSHTEEVSINLSEKLDITGQIRAAVDQYRLQSLADQFQYEYVRNQRILRAKTIYFALLRAQHLVQVDKASLTTAQRQFLDAKNLNAAQVGERIDVYRAATQAANAQQQLTSAQNDLDIARANFNDLTGRPLSLPVTVVDIPGVDVGVDISGVDVGVPSTLSFTPFTVAPSEVDSINLDASLQTALLRRPEILSDQVNVRVEETGVKLARAGLEPTLSISGEGLYYPTLSFQHPRKHVADITATVRIPLYDGGASRDRIAVARLRTQNAQTILGSAKSDVALDVRQNYLNLQTAARQIASVNTALQQAIAARQLAQARYKGQVDTYLEVTDAQSALAQAENNQVDAVYNYLTTRAQFENAIGVPQTL